MIRHYEAIGLLRELPRSDAGYRQLSDRDVSVLQFIRRARLLGFDMEDIRALLRLWQDPARTSREVKSVASSRLRDVEHRLDELRRMEATLRELLDACQGDDDPHCAILDRLSR